MTPQLRMEAGVGFPSGSIGESGWATLKDWMAEELEKHPECTSAYIVAQNGDLIGGMVRRD